MFEFLLYSFDRKLRSTLLFSSRKTANEQKEKQPLECSVRKGVLRIFAKFTGKHLQIN